MVLSRCQGIFLVTQYDLEVIVEMLSLATALLRLVYHLILSAYYSGGYEIDRDHKSDEEVFSYHATKDGKVFLFWRGKQVMILKETAAQKFLRSIATANQQEAQLIMAKITGNFKHGNER